MIDTGTVRLVILLGMFLYFATDYNTMVATIWGGNANNGDANQTDDDSLRRLPEGPPKEGPHLERMVYAATKKNIDEDDAITRRAKMMTTIKTACLPKLICELTSIAHQDQLSEMERSLLNLIRDTSLSTMAEVASRYHFAAHMGQLISGIEGQGCHNFYPTCPLPTTSVLNMMKKIRLR